MTPINVSFRSPGQSADYEEIQIIDDEITDVIPHKSVIVGFDVMSDTSQKPIDLMSTNSRDEDLDVISSTQSCFVLSN